MNHLSIMPDREAVEVFRTNVETTEAAKVLVAELAPLLPFHKINFDLTDCDRILRIAGSTIEPGKIIECLNTNGYMCEVLP